VWVEVESVEVVEAVKAWRVCLDGVRGMRVQVGDLGQEVVLLRVEGGSAGTVRGTRLRLS
jgi:hypothetical protein